MSFTGAYGSEMGSKIITLILMKPNQSKRHVGKEKNSEKKLSLDKGELQIMKIHYLT